MTPERVAYLKAIGSKEQAIRHALKMAKFSLSETKEWWTKHKYTKPSKINGYKKTVKRQKETVMALRHELHRLKGMDRVVRVKDTYLDCYGSDCFECKCGHEVEVGYYKHCPWCGRRILREKVK